MELNCEVFYLCLLLLFMVRGQYAQSPCPEYFEYRTDEAGVYGVIHLRPLSGSVTSIVTKITFTVATRLSTSYLGKIETIGDDLSLLRQYNSGETIHYRVDFPVTSPLPRITSLTINDDQVCYGPGDRPLPSTYITRIALSHTLFLRNKEGNFYDRPILNLHTTQPPIKFYETNSEFNYPTINRDNELNEFWNSNSYPFNVIQNSQNDFEVYDRRPATRPFHSPIFYPTQAPRNPIRNNPEPTIPPTQPTTRRPEIITTTSTTPAPRPTSSVRDHSECGINTNIESVPLVYNGLSYTRGEWPWLVAIFKRKDIGLSYICSGTLISNRHVITAAHCMHRSTSITAKQDIVVKAGVYNILDWGDDDITVTRTLADANIHESYNASTLANDILLLTFDRPVEFNAYIKAACLWSGNVDLMNIVGATGVVTGWGLSEIGPAGKGEPRMVRMPVVSTVQCRASKPDFHKLTSDNTLCAGDRNGAGPCLGDSGGGLYLLDHGRWKVRGIVSLSLMSTNGEMSCNLNDYIVFTDAAKYLSWISKGMSAPVES